MTMTMTMTMTGDDKAGGYTYKWVAHHKERLAELICEQTEAAGLAKGQPAVEVRPRVEFFLNNFVEYLRTGDMTIIARQLEVSARKWLERGEPLGPKDTEEQHAFILAAFSIALAESAELSQAEHSQLLKHTERIMNNVATTAKTIHSRLFLERGAAAAATSTATPSTIRSAPLESKSKTKREN